MASAKARNIGNRKPEIGNRKSEITSTLLPLTSYLIFLCLLQFALLIDSTARFNLVFVETFTIDSIDITLRHKGVRVEFLD